MEASCSSSQESCSNFKQGLCMDVLCPKWHNYMYCKNYANNLSCPKVELCPYMHVSHTEQILYERGSRDIRKIIGSEALRTFQIGGVCFKYRDRRNCTRGNRCKFAHLRVGDSKKVDCPVCQTIPEVKDLCLLGCRHFLCFACLGRLMTIGFDVPYIQCPVCRKSVTAHRLSHLN